MMEESIRQNATVALDQAEYQKRFDDLSQRFDTVKQQHSEVTDRISDMKSRCSATASGLACWTMPPSTPMAA